MGTESSCSSSRFTERRRYFKDKKLLILKAYRDNLERKLASINASIDTLKKQIERDQTEST